MRMKHMLAIAAALLVCAATSGCNTGGGYGAAGGCATGSCGGLTGMMGGMGGGMFAGGSGPQVTPETLAADGYGNRGGHTGPLAGFVGQHHRGPQSHMGGMPGPADGPPSPQVTYPYYTTRGPRDYFAANPPSIGP